MAAPDPAGSVSRRQLLAAAAACGLPFTSSAGTTCTPHEIEQAFQRSVAPRLFVPVSQVLLYGWMADLQLADLNIRLIEPQYILVVDRNPGVQAAMLFWRLMAGSYRLLGAAPVSTAGSARVHDLQTPVGLFEQADAGRHSSSCGPASKQHCSPGAPRVYDFGWQRLRRQVVAAKPATVHVELRAADRKAERRLGSACSDGCILAPRRLIDFLDDYALLDAAATSHLQRHDVPYRGRHLLVLDSERGDRAEWSPAPSA